MTNPHKPPKRRRGVILSAAGWQRLQTAQQQAEQADHSSKPYTIEDLNELTHLSRNTLSKVRLRKKPVDRHTLEAYFNTFGLTLRAEDYSQSLTDREKTPKLAQTSQSPLISNRQDWGEAIDVSIFHGRNEELTILNQWLGQERCRLISILGMGGIGKTALSVKLAQQLQHEFEYIIWRSLRNAPNLETLLEELVPFLSTDQDTKADTLHFLKCLQKSRCLVILDNLETILQPGGQAGYYRPGYENYGDLLRIIGESSHKSCFIITSREKPAEIAVFETIEFPVRSLQLSGSLETALALVDTKDLLGTVQNKKDLCKSYGCSPLALKIVTSTIKDLFGGDIAQFLAEETIVFNGVRRLLDQQFERLTELERTLMYWLAINRDWTSISELVTDLVPNVPRSKLLESLESLSWRSLIEKQPGKYTQQPVVMEYATESLTQQVVSELMTQSFSRFTHHALLKTSVKEFVRNSQCRLILDPVLHALKTELRSPSALAKHLQAVLSTLRQNQDYRLSYAGGNVLNLCRQGQLDIKGFDFSQLAIWHAFLQDVELQQTNFTEAEFSNASFAQTFSSILSLAFSPDGQLLAASDTNGECRLWDVADGQLLLTLPGVDWVRSVAFNTNGKLLASGGDDYKIVFWDIQTGQCLKTLQQHTGRVCALMFSPNGQTLVSSSEDQTIRLWEVSSGKCCTIISGHTQQIWSVQFDSEGKRLVSGGEDKTVKIWDVQTGQCLDTFTGHTNWIGSVAFSPDGQLVGSASHDQTIRLWDAQTGECLQILKGHTNWIWSIAFSPDGLILASGSEDHTVRLWNVHTGECLKVLTGHTHRVWSVVFSPDQSMLASGGEDQTIRLWEMSRLVSEEYSAGSYTSQLHWPLSARCLRTLQGHTNQVWGIAFSPDGQRLASVGDEKFIRIWHTETRICNQILAGHTRRISSVDWSPDGVTLASGGEDQTVRLWDIKTGSCLKILSGHTKQIWSVVFSPDGAILASGGEDQTIKLWLVDTQDCVKTMEGHRNWVWSLDFNPVNSLLASGSFDHTVKLWNIETGDCVRTLEGHQGWIMGVAFSPDGQLLASGSPYDKTIRIWEVLTGKCLEILPEQSAYCLAFSSPLRASSSEQDAILAIGGLDQTIKLWNTNTKKITCLPTLHKRWIFDIAFSPDCQTIASGSADATVKLWDVSEGTYLNTLRPHRPYEGMNITGITGLTEAQKSTLMDLGAIAN